MSDFSITVAGGELLTSDAIQPKIINGMSGDRGEYVQSRFCSIVNREWNWGLLVVVMFLDVVVVGCGVMEVLGLES